jgi:LPPG:FO 2-phospho-L-lactate transferase
MATDDPLRTRVRTPEGWMEFQPWFVGAQAKPEVLEVEFVGAQRARVSAEVAEAILRAELIVIAPSNPLISIPPILAVDGVREAIASARTRGVQVIGVSPIVAGKAIKGPADRMLRAAGLPSSPVGVARALPGLFDALLVEESDLTDALRAELAPLVPRVAGATTVMHDGDARLSLAQQLLQAALNAA